MIGVVRRKAIPNRVKLIAALARFGLRVEQVQFDHSPPLALREWDDSAGDYRPAANDPLHIQMLIMEEHRTKTFGRLATVADGDVHKIAKAKRLSRKHQEFRDRLLRKDAGEQARVGRSRWRKRPFAKQSKGKSR